MSWHPFQLGHVYPLAKVLAASERQLRVVKDVEEKRRRIELMRSCGPNEMLWSPVGKGWGSSPFNPNAWRATDGAPIRWLDVPAIRNQVHSNSARLFDEDGSEAASDDSPKFVPKDGDERALIERQICERRGQQSFRNDLRERYGDRCLVTGCKVLAVLEAAHIKPYQGEKANHLENGLLLRADIHTLFDLDLLGIEPKSLRIELHPSLADSSAYKTLAGKTLRCPAKRRPSKDALNLRYERFKERLLISSES